MFTQGYLSYLVFITLVFLVDLFLTSDFSFFFKKYKNIKWNDGNNHKKTVQHRIKIVKRFHKFFIRILRGSIAENFLEFDGNWRDDENKTLAEMSWKTQITSVISMVRQHQKNNRIRKTGKRSGKDKSTSIYLKICRALKSPKDFSPFPFTKRYPYSNYSNFVFNDLIKRFLSW